MSVRGSYDVTSTAPIRNWKMPVIINGDLYGEFKF